MHLKQTNFDSRLTPGISTEFRSTPKTKGATDL